MNWLVRNSINDLFGIKNENSEMMDSDYQEKSKSKTLQKINKFNQNN
jgi:hypothetical protein